MLHTIAFQEIRYLQNVEKLSEVLTKIDRRDLLYKLESREGEKHNLNPNSLIVPSPPVAPNVQVTPSVSVVPSAPIFARTRHNSFCVPESSFPLYLEIADQDIDEYHSV